MITRHYVELAAAFVRGRLALHDLADGDLIAEAQRRGLRLKMVAPSLYKGPEWRERLRRQALEQGLHAERVVRETDPSDEAEGLYIKIEDGGRVVDRLKWIRPSFLTAVTQSEGHWLNRPIVPNMLRDDVDILRP